MEERRFGQIRYLDSGSGFPLIWLHAFPLSSSMFEPQLSIAGVRHIAPDLPGFGGTPPRDIRGLETYAEIIIGLADSLKLETFGLAGVSMGGYIALSIARLAPERLRALILLDSRESADAPEAADKRRETAARIRQDDSHDFLVEEMLPRLISTKTIDEQPALAASVRQMMSDASSEGVAAALLAIAERPDSAGVLKELKIPCLFIVGADDELTPVSDSRRMSSLAPDSRLTIIEDAAHLANMERPDDVNGAVQSFVTALRGEA
jgi:pimeloyl-ACP methyl ester carboxylesterase